MIGTLDDMKQNLYANSINQSGFNTWQSAKNQINLQYDRANLQAEYAMEDAISEAYNSYLKQQQAINSSSLGTGYKENLRILNDDALSKAYDTSLSNLAETQMNIEQSRTDALNQLDTALTDEATMMQTYQNAHYDYLVWLYQQNPTLFKTSDWSKYLYNTTDEFGNPITSVMPFEYMRSNLGFVDENGNLTKAGTDFFDQMAHGLIGYDGGKYSFNNFLQQAYADEKLTGQQILDWAASYNPYDVTSDGTRAASFRKMYGDTSDIPSWNRYERMPGSQQSYDTIMNLKPASDIGTIAGSDDYYDDVKGLINKTANDIDKLSNLAKDFEVYGNEFDELRSEIDKYRDIDFYNYHKPGDLASPDELHAVYNDVKSIIKKYNKLLKNVQSKIK